MLVNQSCSFAFGETLNGRTSGKQSHADHATYAAFWHCRLAQLEGVFISRVASGVVGVL
jgi:hypothetical protein